MKRKEDVEAFKNELSNLNYYRKKVIETKEKIEVLEYEMEGVKGVDYGKKKGSTNKTALEIKKLAMGDEMAFLEEIEKKWLLKVSDVVRVLEKMERSDRDVVEQLFVQKKTYRQLCDELGIKSTSSLANAVDNAIACALKKAG